MLAVDVVVDGGDDGGGGDGGGGDGCGGGGDGDGLGGGGDGGGGVGGGGDGGGGDGGGERQLEPVSAIASMQSLDFMFSDATQISTLTYGSSGGPSCCHCVCGMNGLPGSETSSLQ